ncbi:MAG: hypothetical protein KF836_00660 [Fimbriimonadaceae bacterium]|nr:hypothetical protein [Fimbriimonadaceae bacterium]
MAVKTLVPIFESFSPASPRFFRFLITATTPSIVYVTNNDTVERTGSLKIYISDVLRLKKDVVCQPTSNREGAQIS